MSDCGSTALDALRVVLDLKDSLCCLLVLLTGVARVLVNSSSEDA